jgi:hypothetical protein
MTLKRVEVPSPLLQQQLPRIDYFDAFALDIEPVTQGAGNPETLAPIDALFYTLMQKTPRWISILMRVRDVLVKALGLKVNGSDSRETFIIKMREQKPIAIGDHFGPFHIKARNENEIIAGSNDKHLDFRVSFAYTHAIGEAKAVLVLGTVVQKHNWLGRVYFVVIRPFHLIVVPAMMKRGLAGD